MDGSDSVPLNGRETQELLETFGALAPLLRKANKDPKEDGRDPKKAKTQHKCQETAQALDLPQVVLQMAKLLIRLDVDNNMMRKQDSFVFYMQMEQESVVHALTAKAKSWHHEMAQQEGTMKTQEWRPLRATLMQTLALTLQQRLKRLYECTATDPLFQTAAHHNVLNTKGEFFFQRWDATSKTLTQTDQAPIAMERMKRYADQFVENTMEAANILKFHSLRTSGDQQMTPWLLQISLRCDELQTLLETLAGCKVWNLLGASLKMHTMHQSHQAQQLQNLLGKGKSAGKGKAKR